MKKIGLIFVILIINTLFLLIALNKACFNNVFLKSANRTNIFNASLIGESEDEYNQYILPKGLNIIPIDLGGLTGDDRANGSFGDATLIEQEGNYLLMDAGQDADNNALIEFLKSQNINHFSIYLSHYHKDHYGRINEILKDSYFTIDNVYLPNPSIILSRLDSTKDYYQGIFKNYYEFAERYVDAINDLGANVVIIEQGSFIKIGDATLNVIWDLRSSVFDVDEMYNEDTTAFNGSYMNNTSLVSMIDYKGIKYLSCGDIEEEAERDIINQGLNIKADIFKFSHHGARNSNIEAFVDRVNPIYAFLPNNYQAGENQILWYGDRDNGAYLDLVNSLTSRTNVLSTLYNGNLLYNISPDGDITTDITRNYHTLTVEYHDINTGEILGEDSIYYFNDRAEYHLENINYIKNFDNYVFVNSTYKSNQILAEDDKIICYYEEKNVDVKYSTTDMTNQNIIVTLKANVALNNLDGWTISDDKMSLTKEYTENQTEYIQLFDTTGKVYEVIVRIENIDKTAPIVEVGYSKTEKTNQNVTVIITTDEEIREVERWTLSQDRKSLSKTYDENIDENITIEDLAGNEVIVRVLIANIDKDKETDKDTDTDTEKTIRGDVNENGKIDLGDFLLLKRHMAFVNSSITSIKYPNWKLSDEKVLAGDINNTGSIDIGDVLKIQRYIAASTSQEVAQKQAF